MFPYILSVSNKDISSTLYDLGTSFDRIQETSLNQAILISEHVSVPDKKVPYSVYLYLYENGYVDLSGYLSEKGKQYYELAFIHCNTELSNNYIHDDLLHNPIVNLITQVFYGRGKISKKQLCNLFNFHKIGMEVILDQDINSLLILLNKYSIVTFDKKNGLFVVNESVPSDFDIKQYFIEPTTPYSNIYNFRKVLRTCRGHLFWIDKHFRKEGFEIIIDGLRHEDINSVTIISGKDNLTQSAKTDYMLLKGELQHRTVCLDWRIIDDPLFKWHDRWIVSDNLSYNIPPVLAIIRGQRSEILQTNNRINIDEFFDVSKSVED